MTGGVRYAGDGWEISVVNPDGGGERAVISQEGNRIHACLGDSQEAGCAVTITLSDGKPTLAFEQDPFGVRSIVQKQATTPKGEILHFSSSVDGLNISQKIPNPIDEEALVGYCCFSYVPAPRTIYAGVESIIEPGALLEISDTSALPAEERLQDLLRAAIQKRLTPGAEVGVYLSGGLDSSLVAALLVEVGVHPHLFTLDFGPPFNIELPVAQQVAAHLKLPLHIVPATPWQIAGALPETAHALPQPFGDAVTVPLYLLGKAAKDFVTEVWNGEGGDQLFGGWTNKPMIVAHLYDLYAEESRDEVREYLATYHRFWGLTDRLFTPEMRERVAGVDPAQWVRPALCDTRYPELLHRLRAANLRLKGAQNIAPRMAALADAHRLRVRSPFFDSDLAAWTFTLSPEQILAGACEKFLLKQVAAKYLPSEVVWREKRGMGVPATDWCLSRWRPSRWPIQRLLNHYLSPRRLRTEGRFDPEFVRQLRNGDDPTPESAFRRRRVGEKLWLLLMWELWREVHSVRD